MLPGVNWVRFNSRKVPPSHGSAPFPALLASLALGLGLSIGFPSVISAAGEVPGRGSGAIALASTIAAGGTLFAAPSIGFLTGLMPLDRALLIVAVYCCSSQSLLPVFKSNLWLNQKPRSR